MNWFRSGLFRRFIIAMSMLALLPSTFMGWQLVKISRTGIEEAVEEMHIKLAEKTAENTSLYIGNLDDKMQFALSAMHRKDLTWDIRQGFLRSLIESHDDIE